MDDRTVGALAISACVGAWFAWALPLPRLLIVVGAFVAIMARRPRLLIVFVGLWSSVSGAASLAALRIPPPVGRFTGTVMLMSDPVPVTFGARVDVRVNGRRYEAFVDRVQSRVLMAHLTGESMVVEGTFAARPADAPWLDARHIAARLEIDRIVGWKPAPLMYRIANRVHDALAAGATPLPFDQRALYTGLVYGDDRGQRAVLVDDFRAGGLGHLLAVSGQNVAFVLTAAGPVLRRVSYRVRWPATLVVLAVFVLVTRAEPSVLRAAAMAAVATWASTHGRVAPGLRVLFLAVGTLVLVDPLLVRAVGFQLSVAASLGIIWLGPRLTARVPGPRPVAELLGVTFAAQAAVAPIAVATFGSIPLASIPANLLALPAAGPVMVWGLTGGVVAGALDGRLGRVLQLPTLGALRWITAVAAASGRAPLGALRLSHVVWLAAAFVALAGLSRLATTRGEVWPRPRALTYLRMIAWCVVAIVVAVPIVAARHPPASVGSITRGVWLTRAGGVVVEIDGTALADDALGALRDRDVTRVDLLVVRTTSSSAAAAARELMVRYDPPLVWAPQRHQIRGATVPAVALEVRINDLVVTVVDNDARVRVELRAV